MQVAFNDCKTCNNCETHLYEDFFNLYIFVCGWSFTSDTSMLQNKWLNANVMQNKQTSWILFAIEWEFTWEKVQMTNSTIEKEQLLKALCCATKAWLLSRWRNWIVEKEIEVIYVQNCAYFRSLFKYFCSRSERLPGTHRYCC